MGDVLGKIEVFESGKLIKEINAISKADIKKAGFGDYIFGVVSNWSVIS